MATANFTTKPPMRGVLLYLMEESPVIQYMSSVNSLIGKDWSSNKRGEELMVGLWVVHESGLGLRRLGSTLLDSVSSCIPSFAV